MSTGTLGTCSLWRQMRWRMLLGWTEPEHFIFSYEVWTSFGQIAPNITIYECTTKNVTKTAKTSPKIAYSKPAVLLRGVYIVLSTCPSHKSSPKRLPLLSGAWVCIRLHKCINADKAIKIHKTRFRLCRVGSWSPPPSQQAGPCCPPSPHWGALKT